MDFERAAGRCLMVGLPGPGLDERTARRVAALDPAGIILFGRNLSDPGSTAALIARVRAAAPELALVALDQEGGRVSRLAPWIGPTPPAERLGAAGADTLRAFGAVTGQALISLGFNLNFAPVVDLSPAGAANGIGDRSFGTDARAATRLGGAFLDGLRSAGVAGCLKHFPGLGPTSVDSHVALPTADVSREELLARDVLPFRELARSAPCVMVGHAYYPAIDGADPLPATCSRKIVEGLLREEIGFDGVAVTDDLEMGAVTARDTDGRAAVEALGAGCDLLLYCTDLDRAETAVRALAGAARGDLRLRGRLEQAAARVERLGRRWPLPTDAPSPDAGALARAFDGFRDLA